MRDGQKKDDKMRSEMFKRSRAKIADDSHQNRSLQETVGKDMDVHKEARPSRRSGELRMPQSLKTLVNKLQGLK